MSTSFSIPNDLLSRLSRMHLAADSDHHTTMLRHIHMRASNEHVRFAATNGRILAVIRSDIDDLNGDPCDAILDVHQFNDAIKAIDRAIPLRSNQRVTITLAATEAKVSVPNAAALVCIHAGTYPSFDHVFARTMGQRWVPCISSLDSDLTSVAQKLAGRTKVFFSSPTEMASSTSRLWSMGKADDGDARLPLADIRSLVHAPAYWTDGELALLVMPITRADGDKQLDLSRFVRVDPLAATAAA